MPVFKSKRDSLFLLMIIITGALLLSGCAADEKAWQRAVKENTIESFGEYLDEHPEGKYAGEAMQAVDDLAWKAAASR